MKRKLLSMLLVIGLIISLIPSAAFAAEEGAGNGASDDYIEIWTADDLYNIRSNMCGKYKLMADINLSEVTATGGIYNYKNMGWNPIGSNNTYSKIPFTGILDGKGHTIEGLNINASIKGITELKYVGLFADNQGCICNLKFTGVSIYVYAEADCSGVYFGCVAGFNEGVISNVEVLDGEINGEILGTASKMGYSNQSCGGMAGGIAGGNTRMIASCLNKAKVSVSARDISGYGKTVEGEATGITVGRDGSEVTKCANMGVLVSNRNNSTYGIAKFGTISDSYSTCSSASYGITKTGTAKMCYFTGSGQTSVVKASSCYFLGSGNGGNGWSPLTSEQMKDQQSFSGFDFDNTWEMGTAYPVLRSSEPYEPGEISDSGKKVVRLEIVSMPSKVEYIEGQTFDPYGLKVNAVYDDSSIMECAEYRLSEIDTLPGSKVVEISYNGVTTSFNVFYSEKSVEKIEVKKAPSKTAYYVGEAFDPTGMIVEATYDNGFTETITDYEIGEIEGTGVLVKVELSYGGKTTYVSISVSVQIREIEFEKTSYTLYEGDAETLNVIPTPLDASDKKYEWTTSDPDTVKVDQNGNVTAVKPGKATISACVTKFPEITCDAEIEVLEVKPVRIEIQQKPNVTTYLEGESIDTTGLLVQAYFNNGKNELIDDYTLVDYDKSIGKKEITVVYAGFTDSFEVEFVEKKLLALSVTTQPSKKEYVVGEKFDPTGMVVSASYEGGFTRIIDDYTVGKISGTGEQTIEITYGEKKASVTVLVKEYNAKYVYASQLNRAGTKEYKTQEDTVLVMDEDLFLTSIDPPSRNGVTSPKRDLIIMGSGQLRTNYIAVKDYTQKSGSKVVMSNVAIGLNADNMKIEKDAELSVEKCSVAYSMDIMAKSFISEGNVNLASGNLCNLNADVIKINGGLLSFASTGWGISCKELYINGGELIGVLSASSTDWIITCSKIFQLSEGYYISIPENGKIGTGYASNGNPNIVVTTSNGSTKVYKVHICKCLVHEWDSGKVTLEPTATCEGTRVYTCKHCGKETSEAIAKLKTGWIVLSGKKYYYDENGVKQTGLTEIKQKWYYFDLNGAMQTGWKQLNKKWYYFNTNGEMQTGWQKIGGKWYYFNVNGEMQTGWQKIGGKWYYFNAGGVMQTGWKKIGGKWYFFKAGVMVSGWQKIGKYWYFFAGGAMKTGWMKSGGKWYYFGTDGAMVTGSKKIGSKTYKFNKSGVCQNP